MNLKTTLCVIQRPILTWKLNKEEDAKQETYIYIYNAHLARAVEYTECISAEE